MLHDLPVYINALNACERQKETGQFATFLRNHIAFRSEKFPVLKNLKLQG